MNIGLLPSFFISIIVAFITTLLCVHLLKPVAQHIGLLDTPGGRKTHENSVPLIGGIAIFLGFSFSLLCLNISLSHYRGLLAGSLILILIGVIDDFRELTPRVRLTGQCLAAILLMEWGHVSILHLGDLFFFGTINLDLFWTWCVTILFVLGFINAINMIDGHDGLTGTVIVGQALLLAWLNLQAGFTKHFYVLLLLITAICAFLIFNWPLSKKKRAAIFLGDAGSTFLGFAIVWFAIDLLPAMHAHSISHFPYNVMTVLWILGYPIFDLLAVILHRIKIKKSPLVGGREHLHHVLLDLGCGRRRVTFILFLFSLGLGIMGVFLAKQLVPEAWQFIFYAIVFMIYFLLTVLCHRTVTKQ